VNRRCGRCFVWVGVSVDDEVGGLVQVEKAEHVFEAHTIQRMELLVLSTLEWRMSVVTPFSYIDYFFHKLGISGVLLRALLTRVSEIVLKAVKGECGRRG
jgi:cyclin D1/2/4